MSLFFLSQTPLDWKNYVFFPTETSGRDKPQRGSGGGHLLHSSPGGVHRDATDKCNFFLHFLISYSYLLLLSEYFLQNLLSDLQYVDVARYQIVTASSYLEF